MPGVSAMPRVSVNRRPGPVITHDRSRTPGRRVITGVAPRWLGTTSFRRGMPAAAELRPVAVPGPCPRELRAGQDSLIRPPLGCGRATEVTVVRTDRLWRRLGAAAAC